MKAACYILSVIVILLSFFPCKEKSSPISHGRIVTVQKASKQQAEQPKGNEQCSPFWPCSTCQAPTVAKIFFLSVITLPKVKKVYNLLLPEEVSYRALAVWQPPKLRS